MGLLIGPSDGRAGYNRQQLGCWIRRARGTVCVNLAVSAKI
jgi:hypothetical protein